MPESLPKVALLIETSTAYGRSLIRGIVEYANIATSWVLYNEPSGVLEKRSNVCLADFNGVIMRDTPENLKLLNPDIPTVVAIRYESSVEGVPNIISDGEQIGKTAADYFRLIGVTRFAFCGFEDMPWSRERGQAFMDAAKDAESHHSYSPTAHDTDYSHQLADIADWLQSLPKPIGLLACNDVRGAHIIEACKMRGIRVPQEIAILGVNNDDLICEIASPPLSSIALDTQKAGHDAAKCLDRMMRGKYAALNTIKVGTKGVVTRQSTRVLIDVKDPIVAHALHYITLKSKQSVQVREVAAEIGLCRRSLERRFQKELNSTIHNEIKKARIEAMSRMLLQTDLTVAEIAHNMGFESNNHISRFFTAHMNMTPSAFRSLHKKTAQTQTA